MVSYCAACCRYCQNMESAQGALSEVGDNHPILLSCQKELGHQLPLSSYLLKPMQRLTKYQLLLKVDMIQIFSTVDSDYCDLSPPTNLHQFFYSTKKVFCVLI